MTDDVKIGDSVTCNFDDHDEVLEVLSVCVVSGVEQVRAKTPRGSHVTYPRKYFAKTARSYVETKK